MILFTILLCMLLAIAMVVLIIGSIAGASFIVVFGDVFVCVLLMVWIVKIITKKKE